MNRTSIESHHQHAIDRLTATYDADSRFIALIIGGSVAKGYARPDSDVDFMLVATDAEYQRRQQAGDFFINRRDLCDYEGGYVDGKVINTAYLHRAAESANEPTRAAFQGAFLTFSHDATLSDLLERIPVYPEAGHDERLRAFYSMAFIQNWLIHEATRHQDSYTIARAASQLSLFCGRVILAHNRSLFPYHKWLRRALADAPDKPTDFMSNFDRLCGAPSSQAAEDLFDCVKDFKDWGVSDLDAYSWFLTDVELAWMDGRTPLEDL